MIYFESYNRPPAWKDPGIEARFAGRKNLDEPAHAFPSPISPASPRSASARRTRA